MFVPFRLYFSSQELGDSQQEMQTLCTMARLCLDRGQVDQARCSPRLSHRVSGGVPRAECPTDGSVAK